MELSDKIIAVGKMQKYIAEHIGDIITSDALCGAAGYSKYYAFRIFKELTGVTPFEVVRALRLTRAAQALRDTGEKVADAAFEYGFESHDGFTRAFARQFEITPQKYKRETPAVRYYIQYPVEAYYTMKEGPKTMPEKSIERTMTVTAVNRPARKLILVRSVKATEYFSFCEEAGCEWEGIFNSIPEKYDTPALLTLPRNLIKTGTGNTASGVEVPVDYNKPVPAGCEIIELPPCVMLYFQGPPFENEDDFGEAIGTLWEIMASYSPKTYGWQYAPELAPYFNFGTSAKTGARMAQPVLKI